MLFKDIKPNHTVYIVNQQEVTMTKGQITNISYPYIRDTRNPTQQIPNPFSQVNPLNSERVLDITISMEGRSATYSIPENVSVAFANNLVIATDIEGITKELQSMNTSAAQFLNSVDHQKEVQQEIFNKTRDILAEIDPVSKEKQAIDHRFNTLESNMNNMRNDIAHMSKSITEFLSEFRTPNKK